MSSAMVAIQQAEETAKAMLSQAEEKAVALLQEAKKQAGRLMADAKAEAEKKSGIDLAEVGKLANKTIEEGEKEIEASVFREKESALSRKADVIEEVYSALISGKI